MFSNMYFVFIILYTHYMQMNLQSNIILYIKSVVVFQPVLKLFYDQNIFHNHVFNFLFFSVQNINRLKPHSKITNVPAVFYHTFNMLLNSKSIYVYVLLIIVFNLIYL